MHNWNSSIILINNEFIINPKWQQPLSCTKASKITFAYLSSSKPLATPPNQLSIKLHPFSIKSIGSPSPITTSPKQPNNSLLQKIKSKKPLSFTTKLKTKWSTETITKPISCYSYQKILIMIGQSWRLFIVLILSFWSFLVKKGRNKSKKGFIERVVTLKYRAGVNWMRR